jgi:hypothetical protein
MDDNNPSRKLIALCPNCSGDKNSLTDTPKKNVAPENSQKEMVCMTCAAHFTIGERKIKVEGVNSDEVKDVATHLMKQADEFEQSEKELKQKIILRKELTNDKIKLLFVVGGFWIGAFLGLGYFLLQVSTKNIDWYKYIGVLFALPIFFTLVGAFILKMTSSLKEESFLQIIRLTLNLNFKGLKFLSNSKNNNTSP